MIQKLKFLPLVLVFLGSCSGTGKNKDVSNNDSSAVLLSQFEEINPVDLHIYSPFESPAGKKFEGKEIDPGFYKFLLFDQRHDWIKSDTSERLYACYKFAMEENKTGLIIRRPSQYSATAIDLYVWDNNTKQVVNAENLSDAFGDEGWYFVKDAWITKVNNDKYPDIVTRRKDFNMDLDDTTKISRLDSLFVLLSRGKDFERALLPVDTNKFQLLNWKEKY
jgi:hypothetical protein